MLSLLDVLFWCHLCSLDVDSRFREKSGESGGAVSIPEIFSDTQFFFNFWKSKKMLSLLDVLSTFHFYLS